MEDFIKIHFLSFIILICSISFSFAVGMWYCINGDFRKGLPLLICFVGCAMVLDGLIGGPDKK